MANSFGARHWKIDTAYTFASLPNGHPATVNVHVNEIVYTDASVSNNPFSVQDRNGNPIFEGVAPSDQSPVRSFKVQWANGLQVPTLTPPGKILVAIR
jgi:hypothetical protein